jgi:hypothetical protein
MTYYLFFTFCFLLSKAKDVIFYYFTVIYSILISFDNNLSFLISFSCIFTVVLMG